MRAKTGSCPKLEGHALSWPRFTNGRDEARPSNNQIRTLPKTARLFRFCLAKEGEDFLLDFGRLKHRPVVSGAADRDQLVLHANLIEKGMESLFPPVGLAQGMHHRIGWLRRECHWLATV